MLLDCLFSSLLIRQRLALLSAGSARILDKTVTISRSIRPRIMSRNPHRLTDLKTSQPSSLWSDPKSDSYHNGTGATGTNTSFQRRHYRFKSPMIQMEHSQRTSKSYHLPIGKLIVHYARSPLRHVSTGNEESEVTKVDVVFIPPWFMSNTVIRAHMKYFQSTTSYLLEPIYSLRPVSINQDPELRHAIECFDISKLKDLFSTGRARPTDMILGHRSEHAVTLLEVRSADLCCRCRLN